MICNSVLPSQFGHEKLHHFGFILIGTKDMKNQCAESAHASGILKPLCGFVPIKASLNCFMHVQKMENGKWKMENGGMAEAKRRWRHLKIK